jgi:hypothetical protein
MGGAPGCVLRRGRGTLFASGSSFLWSGAMYSFRATIAAVVLLLAACAGADDRPDEVAATWVTDRELSHRVRIVNTLALRANGTGRQTRDMYSRLAHGTREEVRYRAQHDRGGPWSITWRVQRNEDGRHLCTVDVVKSDSTCAPLTVVPGTSITVGGVTYTRGRSSAP